MIRPRQACRRRLFPARLLGVAIEAVLFDIGGVLEYTPRTGWEQRWAAELGMSIDEFERRLAPVGRPGSLGEITLYGAERRIASVFGLDDAALAEFMGDLWEEYLGTLNEELTAYFASLRPRTGRGSCPTASPARVSVSRPRTGSRICATRSSTRTRWGAEARPPDL